MDLTHAYLGSLYPFQLVTGSRKTGLSPHPQIKIRAMDYLFNTLVSSDIFLIFAT